MSAFSGIAFSEDAFSSFAFDFGSHNESFSSAAFAKDVAFDSNAFSFDAVSRISGTPRKRPIRKKFKSVAAGWSSIPVTEGSNISDEEFLLMSSMDLD